MKRTKITTSASASAAKPAGNQIEYPDSKVPGLALRVAKTGAKSWTFRYRTVQGEQRRLTLGRYPSLGLSDARGRAMRALGDVAGGDDPAKTKRASRAAARAGKLSSVGSLIERYFDDAEKGRHRPNAHPKRASTLGLERYYFERRIKPEIGSLPIADLGRHEVQRFIEELSETSLAGARICRAIVRAAFNYAIRRELAERNPAQFTELPLGRSRERVLTEQEMRAIWAGASDPQSVPGLDMALATGLAMKFAMLTLQRGGECCGLHAREIDRSARLWTIPGERVKNHKTHIVPLSAAAMEILEAAFELARQGRAARIQTKEWAGFAFPSRFEGRALARPSFTRATKRLTGLLKVADATPHDFRRTGATYLTGEQIGIPRFIVSRVLNQASDTGGAAAVTAVYDRNEYLPEKRRALEAWAKLLLEIVEDRQPARNVVTLR